MKIFLFLSTFLSTLLFAENDYTLRFAYGKASQNDLGKIISGQIGSHPKNLSTIALDGGYLYKKNLLDLPLDVYFKGGLSYFNEATRANVLESVVYVKFYYNIVFLENIARFGFGEGVSYVSSVLEAEHDEALLENGNTSNFLNYLDISLDVDLGKLFTYKPLTGTYIGILLKHRSGVFGLVNNVSTGGSNYNSVYIEKNF